MPFEPPFERLHQPPNPPPADDQVDYEALQRKPIWRVTDLVAYLGLESEQVVYKWHAEGKNPPYYKLGKRNYYKRDDVLAWMEQHRNEV